LVRAVKEIEFYDLTESVSAFVTIVMMLFIDNIDNGLTAGLVAYLVVKLATRGFKELNSGAVMCGLLCLIYCMFGLPH